MKTPFLLFAFIGLGAIGCRQDDDTPMAAATSAAAETHPEAARADPLPTAPMPREKRKPSEIIVGKWQVVWAEGPIPKTSEWTFEYTKGGRVHMQYLIKGKVDQDNTGTFKIDGQTLTLTMPTTRNDPAAVLDFRIQSITETEIVILGKSTDKAFDKLILRRDTKN